MDLNNESINLLSTSLMVTEKCTLKCKLCLSYTPYYKNPHVLTVKDAKKTLASYFDVIDTVEKFALTGGEPLSNPSIYEILENVYVYESQITQKVIFITNGTIKLEEKILDLFYKHKSKTQIIINNYGESLSRFANWNYEKVCAYGLKEQVILYSEDNRYGWIDCLDHSCKHFNESARNEQAQHCEFFKGKKYIISRGELHTCTRSFYRMLLEIIPHNKDEYVDLLNEEMTVQQKKMVLRSILIKQSTTSCAYCSGLTKETPRHPAAEQLKKGD